MYRGIFSPSSRITVHADPHREVHATAHLRHRVLSPAAHTRLIHWDSAKRPGVINPWDL